jgi:cysteine sulfinate desulfinase/cysteine desulfurase-like protein
MLAMGVKEELANSLIRFSLGRETSMDEVKAVEASLKMVINRARKG